MYPNIVNKTDSVLILFCAAFGGAYDVNNYINNSNVTLVDLNEDQMRIMKNEIYSNNFGCSFGLYRVYFHLY